RDPGRRLALGLALFVLLRPVMGGAGGRLAGEARAADRVRPRRARDLSVRPAGAGGDAAGVCRDLTAARISGGIVAAGGGGPARRRAAATRGPRDRRAGADGRPALARIG